MAGATVEEDRLARSWSLGTTAIDKAHSGRSRAAWVTPAAEVASSERRMPWAKLATEAARLEPSCECAKAFSAEVLSEQNRTLVLVFTVGSS